MAARRPPGPRGGAFRHTLRAARPSLGWLERYARRYGDTYRVPALVPRREYDGGRWPLVRRDIVIVSAPRDLRAAFSQPGEMLSGGDAREFVAWALGRDSLLVLDGAEHRRERLALLSLLAPDRLAAYDGMAREVARRALEELPASGRLELAPFVDDLLLRVAVRLLFGPLGEEEIARARRFLRGALTASGWAALPTLFPVLRTGLERLGPWRRGGRAPALYRDFRALVGEAVRRRRFDAEGPRTLLDDLLALEAEAESPRELDRRFSRVVTLFGGLDTIAVALAWCCYHLLQDRDALARACDEARGSSPGPSPDGGRSAVPSPGRADGRSSYLEAACREALRVHPPFPIAIRRVRESLDVGGWSLEAGSYLAPCIHLAHRRPEVYPEPGRFRPDRFIGRSYSPWEYLPFGGGARRCLGHAIALRQMTLVLSELLRALDLRPEGSFAPGLRRRAVMLLPRDPLRVEFRRAARPDPAGSSPREDPVRADLPCRAGAAC